MDDEYSPSKVALGMKTKKARAHEERWLYYRETPRLRCAKGWEMCSLGFCSGHFTHFTASHFGWTKENRSL